MALDPKNLDKYLENLKAAETYSKEVNASFSNWETAAKNIKNISNEIKNKQKLIAELTERQVGASVEETKQLKDQVKFEEEKLKQGQEQLKLLRKQASVTKTLFNEAKKAAKGLSSQLWSVVEAFSKADGAARRVSVQMGLGTARMSQFESVAANSASQLALMGMEAGSASEMMGSFADETGRQVILGKKVVVEMGALAQRTGLAHGEMASLAGQMEGFGLGASSSVQMISDIADEADKMGLNTSKVIKNVQKNLKLINKLSFKGGVKGMMKMAAYSEKYKLSMEEVAGFADKVFRPEGAIDAAANLQVLGGSLAKLGDPFQLLYKARNAPEELAESITKAAVASAVFNEKTKEFDVSAYELDRLKEASEATGMSLDMLVTTAKQTAKMNMFEDALKVGGDDKEFLSGIAEMKDGKAQIAIGVDAKGEKKFQDLKNMSKSDQMFYADKLRKEKESNEEAAMRAQGTLELLKNMMNSLLAKLYPLLLDMDKVLRPIIKSAFAFIRDSVVPVVMQALRFLGPKGVIATIFLFKAAQWVARGVQLGIGFNMTAGKGGLLKRLGGRIAGLFKGKQSAVTGPLTKSGKPDMRFKSNKGVGGAGKGSSGAGAMGKSAGGQATNMLKGAAAILILSAALYVFAKALQEFDKLQNGWGTLALAAASLGVLAIGLFAISKIPSQNVLMGALAIAALGIALIPFAYAMNLLGETGVTTMIGAAIALGLFGLAAALMGTALVPILLGSVAILALSGAIAVFGLAMGVAAPGFESFIGAFERLPNLIAPMLLLGPALFGMAVGLGFLSISLLGFGLSWLVGGWAFEDMAETIGALGNVDLSGLGTAVQSINNVNMEKIEALRDLASSLSLFGLFSGGGIKIEFGDIDVSGDIELKGGGKSTQLVMEEPYLTQLKDLIWETTAAGQNGGSR